MNFGWGNQEISRRVFEVSLSLHTVGGRVIAFCLAAMRFSCLAGGSSQGQAFTWGRVNPFQTAQHSLPHQRIISVLVLSVSPSNAMPICINNQICSRKLLPHPYSTYLARKLTSALWLYLCFLPTLYRNSFRNQDNAYSEAFLWTGGMWFSEPT